MGIFGHLLGVIAPVLLCAGVGFLLARFKLPFDAGVITPLVLNVATPALIISHLAEQHVDFPAFSQVLLAALVVMALLAAFGTAVLLALRLPLLAFLGAMMFANTGNVGLPIVHLALGDKGMAFAFAYLIPGSIAVMTIGMWLPMRRISLSTILRSPIIYAIAIGMGCMIFRTAPPAPIQNALLILGGASIPLMLLSLGYSLATLQLGDLKLGLLLAVAHYAVSALSALTALQIIGLDGTARGTFLVETMMPVGVTVYIIAQRYSSEEEARTIASMVLFSTLMTIIVIPLVLEFWV